MRPQIPQSPIPVLLYVIVFQFVLILFFLPLITQYQSKSMKPGPDNPHISVNLPIDKIAPDQEFYGTDEMV